MRMIILLGLLAFFHLTAYAEDKGIFTIESGSFTDQNTLPKKFTCADRNVPPAINWKNIPEGTKSLALVVKDPDAPQGNFYHWIVYNIPPDVSMIPEEMIVPRDKMIIGKNSYGHYHYEGPCPPKGETHLYVFTLYALDSLLKIPVNTNAEDLVNTIQNHAIKLVRLTAIFGRT